jgi:DNA-binding CsgD family transcriptional regulator
VETEGEPTPRSQRSSETRAADEAASDPELGSLVRRLVSRARTHGKGVRSGIGGQAILLDIELDGVRCLLLDTEGATAVSLSPREQEIVRMVARGYPNKTIAAVLEISSWTVSTYVRRIFSKLGVRSRAAMVACVIESGLMLDSIPPERDLEGTWRGALARDAPPVDSGTAAGADEPLRGSP